MTADELKTIRGAARWARPAHRRDPAQEPVRETRRVRRGARAGLAANFDRQDAS